MGNRTTHYFRVNNLSFGGAELISHKGATLAIEPDTTLEILLFGGNLSLRCIARAINPRTINLPTSVDKDGKACVRMGIEIVNLDDERRAILEHFLTLVSGSEVAASQNR